jgi:hypothetical protein
LHKNRYCDGRILADSRRKAEQLQGEVLEIQLESLLKSRFPQDEIEPIAKGTHGGDILQRVRGSLSQACGTIIWEAKRTKH